MQAIERAGDWLDRLFGSAPSPREARRDVWLVPLVIAALYIAGLAAYSKHFRGHVTGFICLGDQRPMPAGTVFEDTYYFRQTAGYDGQFFYLIAFDPFITRGMDRYMDQPAYRYQRVTYPWLARLLALGRPRAIPWALVAVNVAAAAGGAWVVARWAWDSGLHPRMGLFYGLLSGLMIAALRDLSEPTAMTLMVAALYARHRERPWAYVLLMAGALLGREITVLLIPALVVGDLWQRRYRSALLACAPLLLFAAWQSYVYWRLGEAPWKGGQQNVGLPLVGLYNQLTAMAAGPTDWTDASTLYFFGYLLASACAVPIAVRQAWRKLDGVSLAFLGYALLPWVMTDKVWIEAWSFGRVLLPAAVMPIVSYLTTRDRWHFLPLILQAALFVVRHL